MNKIILSTKAPKPLTIERDGEFVIIQLHLNVLRLGPTAAGWLLDALRTVVKTGYAREQALQHEGKKVLSVFNESGYIYIIGVKARFLMKSDVAAKTVEWLEQNLNTTN